MAVCVNYVDTCPKNLKSTGKNLRYGQLIRNERGYEMVGDVCKLDFNHPNYLNETIFNPNSHLNVRARLRHQFRLQK